MSTRLAKDEGLLESVYTVPLSEHARPYEGKRVRTVPDGIADMAFGPRALSGAKWSVMRQTEQRGSGLLQCGHTVAWEHEYIMSTVTKIGCGCELDRARALTRGFASAGNDGSMALPQ